MLKKCLHLNQLVEQLFLVQSFVPFPVFLFIFLSNNSSWRWMKSQHQLSQSTIRSVIYIIAAVHLCQTHQPADNTHNACSSPLLSFLTASFCPCSDIRSVQVFSVCCFQDLKKSPNCASDNLKGLNPPVKSDCSLNTRKLGKSRGLPTRSDVYLLTM